MIDVMVLRRRSNGAGNAPRTGVACIGGDCSLDEHFKAFYDLAVDPPWMRNRWRPYAYANRKCPDDYPVPTEPSPRCPPAFGSAEP